MTKKKRIGLSPLLTLVLCFLTAAAGGAYTVLSLAEEKYGGDHPAYTKQAVRELSSGSMEYKLAEKVLGAEQLAALRAPDQTADANEALLSELSEEEIDPDTNGDGVYIEHIYSATYEGYMMVVKDPKKVFVAINPDMGSGRAAPELEDYVEMHKALAGINGGGFEDAGGTGNGSIPAGITIINGRLISGGSPQPILGITKDHKLVTLTTTGQGALDMGVVEAVTFGPTFITNGKVTYVPGTDNLNNLNPRTAVGQTKDGTFLLLVIDGRGPSSFGAKYEDVVKIFQDYEAVMAGNLDGGNSSVMIYNGRYVHYPVSMYDSRNLPSVLLVRGDE